MKDILDATVICIRSLFVTDKKRILRWINFLETGIAEERKNKKAFKVLIRFLSWRVSRL